MTDPAPAGPEPPTGPLRRVRRAPSGVRTDGVRLVVRGSPLLRWFAVLVVVVLALGVAGEGVHRGGAALAALLALGALVVDRRVRTELHRDGWVLATGRRGRRWVDTRDGARIFLFSQSTGRAGALTGVGIARDRQPVLDGRTLTLETASVDRLGALAGSGSRALRVLAAAHREGVWPAGCWVSLPGAEPLLDPRGRRARAALEAAGLTHEPR